MRIDALTRPTAILAAGLLAACGGGDGGAAGGETGGAGEEAAPAVTIDPSTVGTISGTVNFAGTPPAATPIDMSGEPDCAAAYGDAGPMSNDVIVNDGKLANVFVYLSEGVTDAPPPSGAATLDQHNCRYHPHVLGVQVNQELKITNSDNLLHNINASPSENRGFNISQPRAGIESTQRFAFPEVMIPVRCDVHGWMHAYIGVTDHPYFAVSGEDGSFSIPNVPAGDYAMTAWHERYGVLTANVSVTAQGTAEVSFDYSADMAGADVPLAEPLLVTHGPDGIEVTRGTLQAGAGR